jgi:hypothetical protein
MLSTKYLQNVPREMDKISRTKNKKRSIFRNASQFMDLQLGH